MQPSAYPEYDDPSRKDYRPLRPRRIKTAQVPVRRATTGEVAFILTFFGAEPKDFYFVPGGAEPIHRALRERGLDPNDYVCSMFEITE